MGMDKYDKNEGHRKMEEKYKFEYAEGVEMLLKQRQALEVRKIEKGDYSACDVLIDLDRAIEEAGLNTREREIIELYLVRDWHYIDVCGKFGIQKAALSRQVSRTCGKIAAVYKKWGYGETYIKGDEGNETSA